MESLGGTASLSEGVVHLAPQDQPTFKPETEAATSMGSIDRIDDPISYEAFFLDYLVPNRPCILGSFLTEGWLSRKDWVDDLGRPNFSFLRDHFGDVTVPVANCREVRYDAQPKEDMLLRDYLQYWEKRMDKNHLSDEPCLYMKDMHFTRDCPSYKAYEMAVYFTSDWLNEFWDTRTDCDSDDYRFVYMGPKESWTPFHADVFRSYSWSANVCGSKRWILVLPGQEQLLRDRLGNLPYDVTSCNLRDDKEYPNFNGESYTPVEVVQSAGEVIFVPSGWHHQVYNLKDTISINHNWFNGVSISRSWDFLQRELCTVQASISDCRDMDGWEQQCQLILKASSGMDYQEFFQLLASIAQRRLEVISRSVDEMAAGPFVGRSKKLHSNGACSCSNTRNNETSELSSHRTNDLLVTGPTEDKISTDVVRTRGELSSGQRSNDDFLWKVAKEAQTGEDALDNDLLVTSTMEDKMNTAVVGTESDILSGQRSNDALLQNIAGEAQIGEDWLNHAKRNKDDVTCTVLHDSSKCSSGCKSCERSCDPMSCDTSEFSSEHRSNDDLPRNISEEAQAGEDMLNHAKNNEDNVTCTVPQDSHKQRSSGCESCERSGDQKSCDTTEPGEDLTIYKCREKPYWERSLGCHWHVVYDLKQLVKVLEELENDCDCQLLDISYQGQNPGELVREITEILAKPSPNQIELTGFLTDNVNMGCSGDACRQDIPT